MPFNVVLVLIMCLLLPLNVQVEQHRMSEAKALFYQAIQYCPGAKVCVTLPCIYHMHKRQHPVFYKGLFTSYLVPSNFCYRYNTPNPGYMYPFLSHLGVEIMYTSQSLSLSTVLLSVYHHFCVWANFQLYFVPCGLRCCTGT